MLFELCSRRYDLILCRQTEMILHISLDFEKIMKNRTLPNKIGGKRLRRLKLNSILGQCKMVDKRMTD